MPFGPCPRRGHRPRCVDLPRQDDTMPHPRTSDAPTRRFARQLLAAALAAIATPVFAAHGIEAGDIRRDGAACNDFFDYANGAWRASHPIPDYMDRWSR